MQLDAHLNRQGIVQMSFQIRKGKKSLENSYNEKTNDNYERN